MNYRTFIPNMFTFSNLCCGVVSILFTIKNEFFHAAIFIMLAMLADAMDGRAARYFGVSGKMGEELDSLCDMSSFGVAAGILIYQAHLHEYGLLGLASILFFTVCVCYRLARFNVNTTTVKGFFWGMPSPTGGCLIATFIISGINVPNYLILLGTVIAGYLMISSIKYPDFKGKGNPIKKISTAITAALIIYIIIIIPSSVWLNSLLFLVFLSYALIGIINSFCMLFVKD